jgi:hypothetical protein
MDDPDKGQYPASPFDRRWDMFAGDRKAEQARADAYAALNAREAPDDWVTITDPEHKLRAGIDQFILDRIGDWNYVRDSHGQTPAQAGFLEVRCQRKDLPAEPAKQHFLCFVSRDPAQFYYYVSSSETNTIHCTAIFSRPVHLTRTTLLKRAAEGRLWHIQKPRPTTDDIRKAWETHATFSPAEPMVPTSESTSIRTFDTGATRNTDNSKYDYEGFLSPLALQSFASYMHRHRLQKDGTLRASDNWQKGIPDDVYLKSLWRHFMDLWSIERGHTMISPDDGSVVTKEDALCALMFNVQGLLHEHLKRKESNAGTIPKTE